MITSNMFLAAVEAMVFFPSDVEGKLRAALEAAEAARWNFDMEAAPKDKVLLIAAKYDADTLTVDVCYWTDSGSPGWTAGQTDNCDEDILIDNPYAWAYNIEAPPDAPQRRRLDEDAALGGHAAVRPGHHHGLHSAYRDHDPLRHQGLIKSHFPKGKPQAPTSPPLR